MNIFWAFLVPAAFGMLGTYFGVKKLKGAEYVKALFTLSLVVLAGYGYFLGIRPLFFSGLTAGLVFCTLADYLLGKPDNSRVFIFGLGGFLIGYFIYGLVFFVHGVWGSFSVPALVVLCGLAMVQYKTFRRIEASLRAPVLVYLGVVSFLVFAAVNFAQHPGVSWPRKALVLTGIFFIYGSDSLIAHNLFRTPIDDSDLYILPPYYAGQICVVLSLFLD